MLARVPDPQARRGRRYLLARLGGTPHPLARRIIAPSETRIRTLIQAIGADFLDDLIGGWLRALADAGRLDGLLTAMLHQEKVIIGQVRVPDDTTEVTQVKALLSGVDLEGAVVTADAVHSCRETAQYIAGKGEDGGRGSDYLLFKGNTPSLQRAAFDAIQASCPGRAPEFSELDRSHGRVIRRPIWIADAEEADFPQATQVARIRRDRYDAGGALIAKEIVHAVTNLDTEKADAEALAGIARGQWSIESVHWLRDTESCHQPALSRRGQGGHAYPPGDHTRPKPHARLPSAMRRTSQMTLAIPCCRPATAARPRTAPASRQFR